MRATAAFTLSSAIISRSSASSPIMLSMILSASVVFATVDFRLIRMSRRISTKCRLSSHRAVDVGAGNLVFLRQAVGKDRNVAAVEKIEEPILDVSHFGTQFVDLVTKKIGLRPSQFASQLGQTPKPRV